ncbi:monocarboxylate transporter 13-like isoform X2 [Saccostrea echinata]|uniref:monocarboxylate transporter 13-like isoform X2 n=1 Tax=Saccostrea echinata TaxID=191078 RepID=UPI002A7F34A4|nr:monocarboxylate transporter 13-like isoform X2 [Saccostrea echinata]
MRHLTLPDQGWSWVVLVSSFGSHCIHGFFLTAVGVLQLSLLDHYRENVLKTSWALSIFLGLYSTAGPLASLIANQWSTRVSMITGGLIVSIGHVLTAFMPNIMFVFFTLGIIGGVGMGMCYTTSVVIVGYNFEKKRNFASGVAVSGIGIGAFALAPMMQVVSDYFGYHGLWLICGGLTLQFCVFGALFFPSKLENERKKKTEEDSRTKHGIIGFSDTLKWVREQCSALFSISLVNVYLSMFLCNLGIYLIYLHFASYVTSVGFSKLDAAFLLSVSGICNCFSRILIGSAANASNMDEFVLYAGTFSLTGFTTALFPLYGKTYGGQIFYMITLGLYNGCCYSLLNSICVILAGVKNLAMVYGITMLFTGVGTFLGPLLGGCIVNFGGTYGQSITVAGISILIGSIFAWASGVGDRLGIQIKHNEETIVYDDRENKCFEEQLINEDQSITKNKQVSSKSETRSCNEISSVKKVKDYTYLEESPLISCASGGVDIQGNKQS